MLDPVRCLKLYLAIKLHFTSSYDLFDSGGRVKNANTETLNRNSARKKVIFRLAERFKTYPEVVNYLVAQYAYSDASAIYDVMIADENHKRWQRNKISMSQIIIDDLADLDIEKIIMGTEPPIFRMVAGGTVHIESAAALNNLKNFIHGDYFGFDRLSRTIVKLDRFVKFDKDNVCSQLEINCEAV
jgi:hypothetical protein